MSEEWRDIEGYEGFYQVSSLGRIKGLKRKTIQNRSLKEKIIKPWLMRGYSHVRLCRDGKPKTLQLHRLAAKAFLPNPDDKPCVNHENSIRNDNRIANLNWVTHKENTQHGISHGKIDLLGSANGNSKLTEREVWAIRYEHRIGDLSYSGLASKYSVSKTLIANIVNRRTWDHI